MNSVTLNRDALSHGQIHSKIWLIEELEKLDLPHQVIWLLGGWYALLAFLIFSRGRLQPQRICSFDIDESVKTIAERVNDAWGIGPKKQFYAYTTDALQIDFKKQDYGPLPGIVINTACEHFSMDWLTRIPSGTVVVLQSTDMEHVEHLYRSTSLEDFKLKVGTQLEIVFEGVKNFDYHVFKFNRYMIIGRKV